MANKRQLKKEINIIAEALISETLVSKTFTSGSNDDKINEILGRIFELQEDFLSRVNNHNGTANKSITKGYYKSLISDLDKKTGEILDEVNSL